MKKFTVLAYCVLIWMIVSSLALPPAFAATCIRMLGGSGALNNGDIKFGTVYWDYLDNGCNRRVYGVNASHIPFTADNSVFVDELYPLLQNPWRIHYTNGSGVPTGLALGAEGTALCFHGATSAPTACAVGGSANISDNVYGSEWNGDTVNGASRNAIYDWGHLFDTDDDGKVNVLDLGAGIVKANSSGVVDVATPGTDYVIPAGNVATATALAADPSACAAGQFAKDIAANGTLTCETPVGSGDMLKSIYDADSDNVVNSAEALSAQYIDWNQTTGPTSIANRPTLGTAALQNVGTLTNTYFCTYATGTGFVCNTNPASKQDAHANLTTLSSPGNWKVFYTDGSGVLQSITEGAEGTALCFHGSAAPTACTVGGAPGGSNTQVQFNAGGAFAGNSGFTWDNTLKTLAVDNQVNAAKYGTTATEHYVNVADADPPSAPSEGDCYYDTDDDALLCYNGASWLSGLTSSSSATLTNKTYDTAGTGNVFTHRLQKDYTILDPVAADSSILFKAQFGMTITAIHCLAEGGGTITLQILECTSAGASCAGVDGATTITCDSDGAADDGSLSNADVDAADWVSVIYGAPSGTVNSLSYSIYYSEAQ